MITPLANLRFSAEVDWILVKFQTDRRTNPQTIRRRLPASSYVTPLDKGSGGAATCFTATIQDPRTWAYVDRLMRQVNEHAPLNGHFGVAGVEVSVDASSKANVRSELVEMAAAFYKGLAKPVSGNHRWEGRFKGDVQGFRNGLWTPHRLDAGRVICIGNRDDDLLQRIYVKATDSGGKIALPKDKHRARVEIRLKGAALPTLDWEQWKQFNFQTLGEWFSFRRCRDDLMPLTRVLMDRRPHIGTMPGRGRRKHNGATQAYTPLTRKAYDALRKLTTKMCVTR